jgi:hypothetical protein
LSLAVGQEVEVQVTLIPPTPAPGSAALAKVYAILGERYTSSHPDTAVAHNEHPP